MILFKNLVASPCHTIPDNSLLLLNGIVASTGCSHKSTRAGSNACHLSRIARARALRLRQMLRQRLPLLELHIWLDWQGKFVQRMLYTLADRVHIDTR
ncbi:MAG: hypothetical protein IMF11_17410 [Proteobacteria bacterium]|nr:hypothetical protein [Pseudomonadota bacterium]